MNNNKEFLEKMRTKLIQHKAKTIEKKILYAYHSGNYDEVEKLTTQLMELNNKQMDKLSEKMDQKLAKTEKQIDEAFDALGMSFSPVQQQLVKEAITSKPLSKEEDEEVERILQEIMNNDNKGK